MLMNICFIIIIEYDKQRSNSVTTFEGLRYALQNLNVPLQLMLKCIVEKRLWVIQSTWEFWVSVSSYKIWYRVCVNLCVNWKLILQRPWKLNTFSGLYKYCYIIHHKIVKLGYTVIYILCMLICSCLNHGMIFS